MAGKSANYFQAIGTYFRDKRVKSGFTQAQLADALKFKSSQMISNWERGQCAPPIDAMAEMVRLFSLSRKEVVTLLLKENKKLLEHELGARLDRRPSGRRR